MAAHTISDFLSQIKKTDLARSNRYEIFFGLPKVLQGQVRTDQARVLSMMAEDVLIPGMILGTRPFRFNNLNEQRAHVIDFGGDSISFTFLVDGSWSAKDFFGDWMRKTINTRNKRTVEYPENYYATIDIHALNKKDQKTAHWKIYDAFPRSIAPISASYQNSEVMRLPVSFAYKNWEVIKTYNSEGGAGIVTE
jgi:hypothetical protein